MKFSCLMCAHAEKYYNYKLFQPFTKRKAQDIIPVDLSLFIEVASGNRQIKSLLDGFETKISAGDYDCDAVSLAVNWLAAGLSNCELDVLMLLVERLTNKEITDLLFLFLPSRRNGIQQILQA